MPKQEDPLMLGGLDAEEIEVAVESRKNPSKKGTESAQRNATVNEKREERLASKDTGGVKQTAKSAPAAAAPEPEVDKSALLDKAGKYKERFPTLKSRNKLSGKSTVEEIEDELHFMQQQLSGEGSNDIGVNVLVGAMSGVEALTHHWNPLALNLNGLGRVTSENREQFRDVMDELMIKYGLVMGMGPEARLVLSLGTLIYTVNAANSGDAKVASALARMNKEAPTVPKDL